MKRISTIIADYLLKKRVISKRDYLIYQYGVHVGLELFSTFFTILIIVLFTRSSKEGLIILGVFSIIRMYSGGIHLKHFGACYCMSCIVFLGSIIICKNVIFPHCVVVYTNIIGSIVILYFGPIEPWDYDMTEEEIKRLKQGLFIAICIIELIGAILWKYKLLIEFTALTLGIALNVMSIIMAKMNYRVKTQKSR